MEDSRIIALYWQRDESALVLTRARYGAYCREMPLSAKTIPIGVRGNGCPPTVPTVCALI